MDAERVHVLHVTDRDAVVEAVADHFVFNFFPAAEGFLHEHLRREGEGLLRHGVQLGLVLAEAGAQAAQRISRADDDRITDLAGRGAGLFESGRRMGPDGLHADLIQPLHEQFAVFRVDDGFDGGAQHLHAVPLEHAAAEQFHAAVQRRLSAEGEQDAVRPLLLDDLLHELRSHGQEIHFVRHALGSLDGSDVGVHEHGPDALLSEGLQGLGTTIVEFAGLADFQRARAKDKHFPDHSREMKSSNRNSVSTGPPDASGWNWVAKKGFSMCRTPSLVPSFRFSKKGSQPAGSVVGSTA